MTALTAWQLWCCGDPALHTLPLSKIKPYDMSNPNTRKRFSDMKSLMTAIRQKAQQLGVAIPATPTVEQANMVFVQVMPALNIFGTDTHGLSATQRQTRAAQMTFNTTVKAFRKKRKLESTAESNTGEGNDDDDE